MTSRAKRLHHGWWQMGQVMLRSTTSWRPSRIRQAVGRRMRTSAIGVSRSIGLISLILAALVLVSGCVPALVSGRYQTIAHSDIPRGTSFSVVAAAGNSVWSQRVEKEIGSAMKELGFRYVEDVTEADIAVAYLYQVGPGRTIVSSSPDMVHGGQEITSSTDFKSWLGVTVLDVEKSLSKGSPEILWEGQAGISARTSLSPTLAGGGMIDNLVGRVFARFGVTDDGAIFTVGNALN